MPQNHACNVHSDDPPGAAFRHLKPKVTQVTQSKYNFQRFRGHAAKVLHIGRANVQNGRIRALRVLPRCARSFFAQLKSQRTESELGRRI